MILKYQNENDNQNEGYNFRDRTKFPLKNK